MSFKLTFNKPAFDKWFDDKSETHLQVIPNGGHVEFAFTSKPDSHSYRIDMRARGGCEVVVAPENHDDEDGQAFANEIEGMLKNPYGSFFLLTSKKNRLIAEPYPSRDAPSKFQPHVRIWSVKDNTYKSKAPGTPPAPKPSSAAAAIPAPVSSEPLPLTGERLTEEIEAAYETVMRAEGRVGRASNEVVRCRNLVLAFEDLVAKGFGGTSSRETAMSTAPSSPAPMIELPESAPEQIAPIMQHGFIDSTVFAKTMAATLAAMQQMGISVASSAPQAGPAPVAALPAPASAPALATEPAAEPSARRAAVAKPPKASKQAVSQPTGEEVQVKRKRGRPPGSGKNQRFAREATPVVTSETASDAEPELFEEPVKEPVVEIAPAPKAAEPVQEPAPQAAVTIAETDADIDEMALAMNLGEQMRSWRARKSNEPSKDAASSRPATPGTLSLGSGRRTITRPGNTPHHVDVEVKGRRRPKP